jgi:mRNA interferase MazF
MKRGEIWTASGGPDYASNPRPVVIIQDDVFDGIGSVTICPLTTDPTEAPLFRLAIEPKDRNGLKSASRIMVDKVTTVAKSKLGERVGRIEDEEIVRLNQALVVVLGLAVSPKSWLRS